MNRLLLNGFVIVVLCVLASCAKDLTPQESIALAREHVASKEYESADIELRNAALKYPSNADIRYELGKSALILGDVQGAEKEARRAVELGMPPEEVTLMLVNAIFLQGDFDRVLAESENLPAELDVSERADILAYRAHALIQKQQYRLADAAIAAALELKEDSVTALLAKASYEAHVGRRETAMTLATRAAELDPKSPDAWALIGDLYAADNKLPAAREAYDKAVANREYVSLSRARRAFILAQLGDFKAAKNDIEHVIGVGYKDHAYVNFVQGYLAFRQSKYPDATESLGKAVAADPKNALSKLYLAASYMKAGRLEEARRISNQLYSDIPNSIEVARLVASIDIAQQDFGAARTALVKMLEVDEQDTVALGMLGSMALMEGDGDQGVDYFQRYLAVAPDDPAVQRMLNMAMTMRGDFVTEVAAAAEQQVPLEEFDRALLSAASALKEGQLKEAVAIAENLHQQFPQRVEPLNLLAAIYLSVGDWRKGKALLEQTLSLQPLEPSAVKNMSQIWLRTGEEARAVQLLSDYLKANPEDQEAIGIMSELIVATNEYGKSETLLIELLEKNPVNLELKARLMQLYFDNGKYEQILVATESMSDEVIQSQPALIELRGKSYVNQGDAVAAAKVWEKWVELSPDSVLANFYHADALAQSGQLELALKFLQVSRERKPGYLPARIALIRLTALSGDMDKAFAEMEKLQAEQQEDRADISYTRGWLAARSGRYEDAEKALQTALSLEPTPEMALLLFVTLNSLGRADEAQASLEAWMEKFPENIGMMTVLGQNYLTRKETDKAMGLYQRMLGVRPQSVLALNNLAWLLRDKDPKQALDYARRANVLAPEDPYVLSTLGPLLVESGQTGEGEQMLRKAVALYPDNMQSKLDLARILLKLGKQGAAKPYLQEVVSSADNESLVAEARDLLEVANTGG